MAGTKMFFPRLRLWQLLSAPGGKTAEQAVADANANVRALEGEAAIELTARLAEIEQILRLAGKSLPPEALAAIQNRADQIACLAGTFGHEMLDKRARWLCDEIDKVPPKTSADAGFVNAQLRAMRMLTPQQKN